MKQIDVSILPAKGLCEMCADRSDCPMKSMLPTHRWLQIEFGEYYGNIAPDAWVEFAIDEIDFVGEEVTWCPMYVKDTE